MRSTPLPRRSHTVVLRILTDGVGSAEFENDGLTGVFRTLRIRSQEAIVAASLGGSLAWKPHGRMIVVRPLVKDQPERAKVELGE